MAAAFHTASLLSIIEQGQKMESLFVRVLLEAAVKLSTITDANIFVMVETGHGRKWAGRRALKEEFLQGKLRNKTDDEEVFFEDEESPATPIVIPQPPSPMASEGESAQAFDAAVDAATSTLPAQGEEEGGEASRGGGGAGDVSSRVDTPVGTASVDINDHLFHETASATVPHSHSSPSSTVEAAAASLPPLTPSLSPIVSHPHPSLHAPLPPPPLPYVPSIPTPADGGIASAGVSSSLPPPSLALADRTNVTAPDNDGVVCSGATFGAGGSVLLPGGAALPKLQHMGEISSLAKSHKSKKKKNHPESPQQLPNMHQHQLQQQQPQQQQQQQHHHHHSQFSFPQFVPTIISTPSSSESHLPSSFESKNGAPFKEFLVKPIVDPTADEASQHQQQRLQHFDDSSGESALNGAANCAVPPPPPPPLTPHSAAPAFAPHRPLVGSQKRKGRPTVGHLLHQKEKMMRTSESVSTAECQQLLLQQQQQQQRPHSSASGGEGKSDDAVVAFHALDDSGIHADESFPSSTPKVIELEMSAGEAPPPPQNNAFTKKSTMRLIPIRPKTKSKVHLTFQDENNIETNAFPTVRDAAGVVGNNINNNTGDGASATPPGGGGDSGMVLELYDPNPLVINETTPPPPETPRRRGVGVSGPPFFCEICNHEFSKPHHLSRHKKEQHTNVQGHPCMFCQHKFKRKEHLRRHVLSRHRTEIPDSVEAQRLFEAPPPSAAQAAAAAAAAAAAYSSLSNVVDANGLLLLPPPPPQLPPPPHSSMASPQSIALLPPTLAFLPPLSPAMNLAAPRMNRSEDEPEEDDAEVVAPPTASTPSEGPFEGEDGDAYFVEAEGMTGDEEEEEMTMRDGGGSCAVSTRHSDNNDVDEEEEEEVRLVNDDDDDDDDDDDERRKENLSVNGGREVRAKFFVTNRVPASDLIKN